MSNKIYYSTDADEISVICPNCSAKATFRQSVSIEIKLKKDIQYFKKSKFFDYKKTTFSHSAIFYPDLHSTVNIEDLPDGYTVNDFKHRNTLNYDCTPGTKICNHCGTKKKSNLSWPKDAYFKCEIKGKVLWAFNREHLISLRDFIESDTRVTADKYYQYFLRKIPSIFLNRKNRKEVVKKLNKLIFQKN